MSQRFIRTFALPVSEYNATTKCRDCEIFIGTGHEDEYPIAAPDGDGVLCQSCLTALRRRNRAGTYEQVNWTSP
ncbi:MAG: hypothetical protein ACKVVP_12640 [Chloroflexota bacterium]